MHSDRHRLLDEGYIILDPGDRRDLVSKREGYFDGTGY
jgi:hypothetical protein